MNRPVDGDLLEFRDPRTGAVRHAVVREVTPERYAQIRKNLGLNNMLTSEGTLPSDATPELRARFAALSAPPGQPASPLALGAVSLPPPAVDAEQIDATGASTAGFSTPENS